MEGRVKELHKLSDLANAATVKFESELQVALFTAWKKYSELG